MKEMENTSNFFNTNVKIPQPKPIGEWKIGDEDYFISFALTKRPNWFRRVMAKFFFGLRWIDYEGPKDVKEIQAGKGAKIGVTKWVEKGRHRR